MKLFSDPATITDVGEPIASSGYVVTAPAVPVIPAPRSLQRPQPTRESPDQGSFANGALKRRLSRVDRWMTGLRSGLVGRFALITGLVFSIVGWIVIGQLEAQARERLEQQAEGRAVALAKSAEAVFQALGLEMSSLLEAAALGEEATEAQMPPQLLAAMAAIEPQATPLEDAAFAIYLPDGTPLFMDERLASPIDGVDLSRGPVSVVDDQTGLYRTMMPLAFAGGGSLQIEIGQEYAPIDAAADAQGDGFLPIVIIGLAGIYIALFPTLAAASTRLKSQAIELKHSLGMERERVEKMVQLEELQRNIANAASHELRTPLTVIRGNAEMLRDKHDQLSPEQLRGLIDGLDNQSAKLSRLVMDLLEADPLSDRIPEPRRERVDVAELVRGTLETIWPPHRHLRLPTSSVVAEVDRRMVTRVVESLAINILKYTPEGTPAEFCVEPVAGGCRIVAQDEGPGIPKAEREEVFSLLTRRPDEAAKPGLGVGLALVRRYAEAHGGTARISDKHKVGTRVEVTLLNGGNDLDRELARLNDSVN